MKQQPEKINLEQWDHRYRSLQQAGLIEPDFGGILSRHVIDGDLRLLRLEYDNSVAALNLWNFLLTEEDRLFDSRKNGRKIVGAMKDLGTVPVIAYCFDELISFYPDGAWWIPCVMELNDGMFGIADSLGIDESFCPVRAMLGAFLSEAHFPIPDLLICSTGAVCDDFSAIAQRLNGLGFPIFWWEIPHRRLPEKDEHAINLPGGFTAPIDQLQFVRTELERIVEAIEQLAGQSLNKDMLRSGIQRANNIRDVLNRLRYLTFTADICPMPALEMLIAEMIAIHYCSDQNLAMVVLTDLLEEVRHRVSAGVGVLQPDAARIFWINPVADLQVMNVLEDCGGRICGTEYLFTHALDPVPVDIDPLDALAQMALADPMVGPAWQRAERICNDIKLFGSEAVIISRIPGASHCAVEGRVIATIIREKIDIPVIEIEVPPVSQSIQPALRTRIEALVETVKNRR